MTDTCTECGTEFENPVSAEEKLLRAIFGHQSLCFQCQKMKLGIAAICKKCDKFAEDPIWVNGNPYHPACTPHSDQEEE